MKKSIGSFIAALRKSHGMTQQEVADSLNVSNKTVSKWERDEGYPEITMIPALAELFNVTSDEILRGERIVREEIAQEKAGAKAEKQIRLLLSQAMTRFKNLSFLAFALIFIGLNCMFTISYAAYRPVIGFGVMLALIAAAAIIELIAANGMNSVYRDSELIEQDSEIFATGMQLLYRYAFASFALALSSVVLSLPLIIIRHTHFVDSVLQFGEYLRILPWLLLLSAALCMLGNAIARNLFKLPGQQASAEQVQKLAALKKKTLIISIIVFGLTIGANFAANYLASNLPVGMQFASREEMEDFAAAARQYEQDKMEAYVNGYVILHQNQVNPGYEKFFYIQEMYESDIVYDWANLKVHYGEDYARLAASRRAIAGGFRVVYFCEIVLVGIMYFRKRAKIA